MMLAIILLGVGFVLVLSAIRGQDPRDVVFQALGRERPNAEN